jgi:hypothetical protein
VELADQRHSNGAEIEEMQGMGIIRRHKRVAALVAVASLTLAGVATAYWTTGGSGAGSADTGTTANVTVNQTSVITGLYPGGPAQALSGNFDNPNPGQVFITSVSATITPFSVQADLTKPACTQADFAIGGTAPVGVQINPGNGVGAWAGLNVSMINAPTNQDNCKNITVPITYTAV